MTASTFSKSASFGRKALGVGTPRSSSFGNPIVTRSGLVWRRFLAVILIGFLVSFILSIGSGYIDVLPSLGKAFNDFSIYKSDNSTDVCEIFDGSWVLDNAYPLYNASACPFAERGFNCLGNGRRDMDYLKWRWKPKNCDIPRFNVQFTLEKLRGKRVVFVGDSMSRTQWESLICLLMTGVEDKESVYEVNGNKITKQIRYLGVRFKSHNFTIEFFRSVFLVQHGWSPRHAPKRVKSTLKLDKLDDISEEWIDSDILLFNSGQWWVPWKLYETGCYFQVGSSIELGMSIPTAFRTALDTWASWIENTIDANRTRVFFRTFEPSHWSNQTHRVCNVTQYPTSETEGRESSTFSDTIIEVVKNMTVQITVLQITSMSAFRSDAHVGVWNQGPSPDCSHWCLPGLPDLWNEILLSYVLTTTQNFAKTGYYLTSFCNYLETFSYFPSFMLSTPQDISAFLPQNQFLDIFRNVYGYRLIIHTKYVSSKDIPGL